jgi:hypothetical protein
MIGRAAADSIGYLRHPRRTAVIATTERSLAEAATVTATAVLLTAVPLGLTPAPEQPRTVPRTIALGLGWLNGHRLALTVLALGALTLVTVGGYAGTCVLVRLLRAGAAVDWRRLLAGIGWVNALSCLSAAIPIPAIALQLAHVGAWRPLNAVTLPLSLLVGAWVAVPAWYAVRAATGLGRLRAGLALALPTLAMVALLVAGTLVAFQVAFG